MSQVIWSVQIQIVETDMESEESESFGHYINITKTEQEARAIFDRLVAELTEGAGVPGGKT